MSEAKYVIRLDEDLNLVTFEVDGEPGEPPTGDLGEPCEVTVVGSNPAGGEVKIEQYASGQVCFVCNGVRICVPTAAQETQTSTYGGS